MFQLSYINYLLMLFVVAGVLVLVFDWMLYKNEGQQKEEKVSRVLGWLNIVLGVGGYLGNLLLQQFLY